MMMNKDTLFWIPRHKEIEGNKEANNQAKKGDGATLIKLPEPVCCLKDSIYK